MKHVIVCFFVTGIIFGAEEPPFFNKKEAPGIADQWAKYTAQEESIPHSHGRRRNRLNDDPEQQEEHAQDCYQNVIAQLHTIEQAIEEKNTEKKLSELELACRVIAQALLHFHDQGNKKALEQADTRALALAARIKLMQDPFWHVIVHQISERKKTALPPTYSIEELEQDLYIPESTKDRLIKLLLEATQRIERVSTEAIDELSSELAPHKQTPEEFLALLYKLEQPPLVTRIKEDKKTAIDLYNGAVISEIHAKLRFLHLENKHEYPELEQVFGSVALLYLDAYDHGHPKGLEEAISIMRGGIMDTIIRWKERHPIQHPYEYTSSIWEEINKRRFAHAGAAGAAPSSSTSLSHEAP